MLALAGKTVCTGILPHVGTVSSVPSELDVVAMRCGTVLEDDDEFMGGAAYKEPIPPLHPHTDILELLESGFSGLQHLLAVPPVNKDVEERGRSAVAVQ